jgi:Ca-activated chloride channel family protein
VRVSVLGVGTDQGAPVALAQGGFLKDASGNIVLPKLDAAKLRQIAQAGGGDYVGIQPDASDIDAILSTSAISSPATAREVKATTERFLDRGPWLVLLLLPLAAIGFRRGWLAMLPLVLMAHAAPAQAFAWRDLWQRPDQQARAQLDAGHAQQAQALARDPALRGAAAYRAGDYAAAESDFARGGDARSAYNRGNALAKQRQYEQAIAAYDEALKRDPQLADAQANKKAIEDWLKQHKQNQQQSQQNQKNQKQEQSGKNKDGSQSDSDKSQGENKQGEQQQSGDQSGSDKQGEQNSQSPDQARSQDQSRSGKDESAQPSAQDAEKSRQAEREAGDEFGKQMDKALQQQGHKAAQEKPDQAKPVRLGAREGDAPRSERDQAVEQWLQRVPDDPGGLLRRKFRLEYEMRRNGGRLPQDDLQ